MNGHVVSFTVTFDPASFYGHSEFELAIGKIFHGFDDAFYDAYHAKIPKAKGYEERLLAYELFHYLNHWYAGKNQLQYENSVS